MSIEVTVSVPDQELLVLLIELGVVTVIPTYETQGPAEKFRAPMAIQSKNPLPPSFGATASQNDSACSFFTDYF